MQKHEARNQYENYVYQMKSTIEDEKLKEKLGSHYQEIKDKLEQGAQVLEVENANTKEEYEKAQQELEQFINPIEKLVQALEEEKISDNPPPPPHQPQYEAEPDPLN